MGGAVCFFFGSCIAWDGGVAFVLYIAFGKGVGVR